MNSRKGIPFAAIAVLGLAAAALFQLYPGPGVEVSEPARPEPAQAQNPAPGAAAPTVAAVAAAAGRTPIVAKEPVRQMSKEEVAKIVEQRNTSERAELQRFIEQGWKPVEAPQPDMSVLSLDPKLLRGRERELRVHLETNALGAQQLDNAAVIAVEAEEARTRTAAIQSLGRSQDPHAQELLLQLFDEVEEHEDRRLVLGFIRPRGLEDASAQWLLGKIADPHLAEEFKKQMTFSLVLAEIAESGDRHKQNLSRLLERVPVDWRQEVLNTYATITKE